MMRVGIKILGLVILAVAAAQPVGAATITFNSRSPFEGSLATFQTEAYSHPDGLYSDGAIDAELGPGVPTHRNTALADFNQIFNGRFNASNTTFLVDFTNATLATPNGVFGMGFNYGQVFAQMNAFVTFGDGSTQEYALSSASDPTATAQFFGVTSDLLIKQVHVSIPTNVSGITNASFFMDNLTWGAAESEEIHTDIAPVPEPGTLTLLSLAVGGVGVLRGKKRS